MNDNYYLSTQYNFTAYPFSTQNYTYCHARYPSILFFLLICRPHLSLSPILLKSNNTVIGIQFVTLSY